MKAGWALREDKRLHAAGTVNGAPACGRDGWRPYAKVGWAAALLVALAASVGAQEAKYEVAAGQTVEGDVVTARKSVHVWGKVNGSVLATRGEVRLYNGSEVTGNVVVSGGKLTREDGAKVGGSVMVIPPAQVSPPGDAPTEVPAAPEAPSVPEAPASPQVPDTPGPPEVSHLPSPPMVHSGDMVRYGSPAHVGRSEEVDGDVIAFGGPIAIEGVVRGDVASFGAPIEISGHVTGDVMSTGGPLNLLDGARIDGDATAIGGPLNRGANVTIGGSSGTVGGPLGHVPWALLGSLPGTVPASSEHHASAAWSALGRAFGWAFSTVTVLLLAGLVALVFPRAARTVADKVEEEPLRVACFGVVGWLLLLPILFVLVILVLTWVLIPFFLLAVAGLLVIGCVGVGLYGGRWVAHRLNRRVASVAALTVIGVAALRVAGLVSVLPYGWALGGLLTTAVLVMGLGAALMTRFGTDPSGTWLAQRFHHNGRSNGHRPGPPPTQAPPPPGPRPAPPGTEHDLDDRTREALADLPEDGEA